jgi:hypothetical protein
MVDSPESLERCVEESEVVGVRGHVAMDELYSGCRRVQVELEGAGWFVEDVAEEDVRFCGVEEADEDGADADGALGWVRLVL